MPIDRALPPDDDPADGYLTEIDYTFDYHHRTNPQYMRLALLRSGLQPPDVATACELGFGQGVSLAFHAAAGGAHWIGTDINERHLHHARDLVAAAGTSATLYGDPFAEFARRDDLPDVDFIVMHGVWSWVSDRNREVLVDFVSRRLRPGGVLYVSYNTLPGAAAFGPIRHLVSEHARRAPGGGNIADRIDRALAFARTLLEANPPYVQDTPRVRQALEGLIGSDHRYLAHEYFNRDWCPMHFAEVASRLGAAGLVFANGGYGSPFQPLLIEPAQQELLDGMEDPVLRESVIDFLVNRQFRWDYWMKPPAPTTRDAARAIRDERFILATDRPSLPFEVRAPLKLRGRGPDDAHVTAVLDLLSDNRPRSLGDIEAALAGTANLAAIVDVTVLLLNHGLAAAAQPVAQAERARPACDRINAHILEQADRGGNIRHLASPVLGGGFEVPLAEQRLLRARRSGGPPEGTFAGPDRRLSLLESLLIA